MQVTQKPLNRFLFRRHKAWPLFSCLMTCTSATGSGFPSNVWIVLVFEATTKGFDSAEEKKTFQLVQVQASLVTKPTIWQFNQTTIFSFLNLHYYFFGSCHHDCAVCRGTRWFCRPFSKLLCNSFWGAPCIDISQRSLKPQLLDSKCCGRELICRFGRRKIWWNASLQHFRKTSIELTLKQFFIDDGINSDCVCHRLRSEICLSFLELRGIWFSWI